MLTFIPIMKLAARFLFWLTGWKVKGEVPDLKKFVVIMAPHTSAWDAVIGLLARFILEIDFAFFGKQEAFAFSGRHNSSPIGWNTG